MISAYEVLAYLDIHLRYSDRRDRGCGLLGGYYTFQQSFDALQLRDQ